MKLILLAVLYENILQSFSLIAENKHASNQSRSLMTSTNGLRMHANQKKANPDCLGLVCQSINSGTTHYSTISISKFKHNAAYRR